MDRIAPRLVAAGRITNRRDGKHYLRFVEIVTEGGGGSVELHVVRDNPVRRRYPVRRDGGAS